MALIITDGCTGCAACEPECPNNAIYETDDGVYAIIPDKCTECVGHHDTSQCVLRCPVNCIVSDVSRQETKDELLKKFHSLTGA